MGKREQEEILLKREASMASMSLGIGLTFMRKYDFAAPGFIFSSFYSVTTGIERLLKLILIYNYRLKNQGKYPDNKHLRSFGHNIGDLFREAIRINDDFNFDNDSVRFSDDIIYEKILCFLSDFALQARYYNLDNLTGRTHNHKEPFERWNDEINSLILKRHYRLTNKRKDYLAVLSGLMESCTSVIHMSDSGEPIRTATDLVAHADTVKTKQKYSMYYTYMLINFLSKLFKLLECKGNYYPYLSEHFSIFNWSDKSAILRKRSWNPAPPYHF